MTREQKAELIRTLEERREDIIKLREHATSSYDKTLHSGAVLGLNDAISIVKDFPISA